MGIIMPSLAQNLRNRSSRHITDIDVHREYKRIVLSAGNDKKKHDKIVSKAKKVRVRERIAFDCHDVE